MQRRHSLAIGLLTVVGAALLGAASAAATTGVSIDVARIAVSEDLFAGGEYRLPTFGVRNPGTEPTSYHLTISYVDDQSALRPPQSWFDFAPAEVTLAPAGSRPIQTRLAIPPDAEPGDYAALIGPQIASNDGGAEIGAAAAARLSFRVVRSGLLDGWLRALSRSLAEHPWLLGIAAAIILAGASWFLRRRFAFSITRRT